jgi:hypothetical protein
LVTVGGGGSNHNNVELLSLDRPLFPAAFAAADRLRGVHPGFVTDDNRARRTVVLHRFSTNDGYVEFRRKLADAAEAERAVHGQRVPSVRRFSVNDVPLIITERNTPALFGAGLIDKVSENTIRKTARKLAEKFPWVSGRPAPVGREIGRFGWRGQTARLADFVLEACANELGLQVPGRDQARDPLAVGPSPSAVDLTQRHGRELTAFVANLSAPRQLIPRDPLEAAMASRGSNVFQDVGCVACHVPTLGAAKGIYSDLLLHDMGESLADPVPAASRFVRRAARSVSSYGEVVEAVIGEIPELQRLLSDRPFPFAVPLVDGVGKGRRAVQANVATFRRASADLTRRLGIETTDELQREWRTPPLWGVADAAPYLHDGRAPTLLEAILAHDGEARIAIDRFAQQAEEDRAAVLRFLETLRAPVP